MKIKDVKTYADFVEFFEINLVLNNEIVKHFDFEIENGDFYSYYDPDGNEISVDEFNDIEDAYEEYNEVYQYYIIRGCDAETIEYYTDDIILYSSELDMYLWGIQHWGTSWDCVPISLDDPFIE